MPFTPLAVRLPEEMIAEIDALGEGRLDHPDRSTLIRELLAAAIKAHKARARR